MIASPFLVAVTPAALPNVLTDATVSALTVAPTGSPSSAPTPAPGGSPGGSCGCKSTGTQQVAQLASTPTLAPVGVAPAMAVASTTGTKLDFLSDPKNQRWLLWLIVGVALLALFRAGGFKSW